MHWYGGSIAEAVSLSKQKNAIFVVFVEGDNDLSQEMALTIDDTAVVSRLSDQGNFLAIKLKSGSTNYTHFAQIYQFVPVPSLFFIGRNGTPLEVVCAGVQPSNLATRIDRILEEHRKEKSPLVQPSTSSQNIKEQTVNLLQAEASSSAPAKPDTPAPDPRPTSPESSEPAAKIPKTDKEAASKSTDEYEVVCDGDVCVRRHKADGPGTSRQPDTVPMDTQPASSPVIPKAASQEPSTATKAASSPDVGATASAPGPALPTSESAENIEDKLERAKELIEARRREKAEKEKELEKQKEMERRATGKGVNELKKWQADQELKQIQEERKREKMENNLARQRILEQIAQDRAERRARDAPPAPVVNAPPPSVPATSGDGGNRVRIQFKLPDGSSHTAHFHAHDTLADVQRYVADTLEMSMSSFSLWTAFPRRELEGGGATLVSLQLAPSAALLVLPRRPAAAVAPPTHIATILAFLTQMFTSLVLEPSQLLLQWIRARLFPTAPPPQEPAGRASPAPPAAPPATPPAGVRRRGNIHRLPGDMGGDDENNTWNGNSTQQM